MHQVEINVVHTQALQGRVNAFRNAVVPGVVELGGNPDFLTGNARVTNTIANLGLIAVSQGTIPLSIFLSLAIQQPRICNSRVDVPVALQQSVLDSLADLIGSRLPGTKTNSRDLGPGAEGEGLPI